MLTIITMGIHAQPADNSHTTDFSIMFGRSVPVGNYASMSGTNSGYAKVGLCADINSTTLLYSRLSWVNSINISTNAFNQIAYCDDEPDLHISTGRHYTGWVLTGLALKIPASDNFTPYASGQIGLLIGSFPDIIMNRHIESEHVVFDSHFEQTAKSATTMAYALAAGVKVKLVHLAIRYYYASPRYQITTKPSVVIYPTKASRSSMEVSTGMLQFLIGVNF